MDLISSAWKHVLRTETSQKFLLKNFYYNNKGTKKVKDFQKLSNKEIYFILRSNSTKQNKPQSWNLGQNLYDWFQKWTDGYIFSNPTIHRIGNSANILCFRCKELLNFMCHLVSLLLQNWVQSNPLRRSGTPF